MIPYAVYNQLQIGSLTIYTWGLFLSLSFLTGLFLFLWQAKKKNLDLEKMFYLVLTVMISSLLGAKIVFLLQFPSQLLNIANYFNSHGYMFYGGLSGGFLGGWLFIKKAKLDLRLSADLSVLSIALGIFLTRLGCFAIKDHPGAITNLPWGILWPDGFLRHPVALYLSLNGLLVFFLFLYLQNKLKIKGQLFICFVVYYSFTRFLLDFTRASEPYFSDPRLLSLTISQWLSLVLFALGLFYCLRLWQKDLFKIRKK